MIFAEKIITTMNVYAHSTREAKRTSARLLDNEYLRRGLETMADRRKKGSGSVRERSDGRWEGRVIVGYDDNGKPIQKSVFAKTKTECNKKLKQLKDETVMVTGRLPSHAKASMKFGEWMDMWYQYYGKIGVSPTTQDSYKNYIYNHIDQCKCRFKLSSIASVLIADRIPSSLASSSV